ncbi:MAG: hypothetical protein PHR11_05195, partial [Candidatus Omnitrophica bacterium]|nr:hypothetical protein [Candidatus Omnitrophota bacterium]
MWISLEYQLDYIYFLAGSAYFLLGALCLYMQDASRYRLNWRFFGVFAFIFGTLKWQHLFRMHFAAGQAASAFSIFLWAAAFIALLEFGRDNFSRAQKARVRFLPLLYPFILALAVPLFHMRRYNAEAFSQYVFGGLGGAFVFIILLKAALPLARERLPLLFASLCVGLLGILNLTAAPLTLWPAVLTRLNMPLSDLLRTACAMALTTSLYWHYCRVSWNTMNPQERRPFIHYERWLVAAVLVILTGGWAVTNMVAGGREDEERANILLQATIAARSLDIEEYKTLEGGASDTEKPGYQYLREQLKSMEGAAPHIRWLYVMGRSGKEIVFIVDSIPVDSFGHAEPGVLYEQPPAALFEVFSSGKPLTVGPYSDEYGTYVSAFVPVYDPGNGA